MKILFVADVSIDKVIGGAERVLFEQTTRLAKRGHQVHILTRRVNSHESESETIRGVSEWRYAVREKKPLSFLRSSFFNSKTLFESLQDKFSFDIINFHQPFSSLGVLLSQKSRSIKKIYTCHSLSFEEYISRNPKPSDPFQNLYYHINIISRKMIEKNILKKTDGIMTLSRFTQNKLFNIHNISPEKTVIIPGGVDLVRFRPSEDQSLLRQELGIPPEKFILLTVRNMVQRMGLENLLFAFKEIVNKAPDTYLVIGGEGPMKEPLLSLVQELQLNDHTKFADYIDDEKLPSYYQMADLFILPTIELEGFGLVTLEAMASGLPVLGTPVGGTEEILSAFDKTLLFKDTEPSSIADLIIETYQRFKNNPDLKKEMSGQCRSFVEKYYSWDHNINLLEKLFQETLKK